MNPLAAISGLKSGAITAAIGIGLLGTGYNYVGKKLAQADADSCHAQGIVLTASIEKQNRAIKDTADTAVKVEQEAAIYARLKLKESTKMKREIESLGSGPGVMNAWIDRLFVKSQP